MLNHLRFLLFLIGCLAPEFLFAQTYSHPTQGIENTFAGACEENTCTGVYVDDGGTGNNYTNGVNNVYRTFCPNAPGQCIRLTFTQFSLEPEDQFGDCFDYLAIGNGSTQNSPLLWQGCGSTLPPVLTSTDASGCITVRFVSDSITNAPGWRANITCVPCAQQGPSDTLNTDCINAQQICDNPSAIIPNNQGPGLISDACGSGCAISENHSNWFFMNVTSAGTMGFIITPTPTTADFDFALYGPVTGGCANLGAPIRCSYAENSGATGIIDTATDVSEDVHGDAWVSEVMLSVGTYYLMVNHWTYMPNATFTIDFTGTATFDQPAAPVISSNSPLCGGDTLQLTAPTITGATYTWSGPGGWTSAAQNPMRAPAVAGTYTSSYSLNGCTSPTDSISVIVNNPVAQINPSDTSIHAGDTITLVASGGDSYLWSNSEITPGIAVSPADTTTYTVTVTVNSCISTASATVNVIPDASTGINKIETLDFAIVPNPAHDVVTLSGNFGGNATYEIINALGQVVLSDALPDTKKQIELEALQPGFYLVRVTSDNKTGVKLLFCKMQK